MTTGIAITCADGLIVGTDTKVVAGGIKRSDDKLLTSIDLGGKPLIIAVAGRIRHVKDATGWLQSGLAELSEKLGRPPSFDDFLAEVVERALPAYLRDFRDKYFTQPSIQL